MGLKNQPVMVAIMSYEKLNQNPIIYFLIPNFVLTLFSSYLQKSLWMI